MRRWIRNALIAGGLALVGATGTAVAASSSASAPINACVDAKGAMRVLKAGESCGKGESSLSWNIEGPEGQAGPTGATGAMGPIGPIGPIGPEGAAGPQGVQGDPGPMGPMGATGATGPIGPAGPIGLTGAIGPMGPQGPQGEMGLLGPIGPAGPAGAIGPIGPRGLAGVDGAPGPAGPAGAIGPAGPAGAQGPQGLQGPQGPQGAPGDGAGFLLVLASNATPGPNFGYARMNGTLPNQQGIGASFVLNGYYELSNPPNTSGASCTLQLIDQNNNNYNMEITPLGLSVNPYSYPQANNTVREPVAAYMQVNGPWYIRIKCNMGNVVLRAMVTKVGWPGLVQGPQTP